MAQLGARSVCVAGGVGVVHGCRGFIDQAGSLDEEF
jgi:hypothetical protein